MKRTASSSTTALAPIVDHQTLTEYIQSRFDEFSRSQKDVAQYIVDHLDEVAFQTAEELARRANTSSSTVVRFSQALGFHGFPDLQEQAREEYRRRVEARGTGATGTEPLFGLDQSPGEATIAADHQAVEETARRLSRSVLDQAVAEIGKADRVIIVAADQVAYFGTYLRHLLMLLGIQTDIVASHAQEARARLARLDENAVLIGITAGRAHPLVVRSLQLARHRRARTIAITDATLSDAAQLAHLSLFYSSNSPAFVRSHVALLSLLQALAQGVYANDGSRADRIRAYRLK
ncbi:MurR/RpiR family transcriptional regulator [Patulibacter brassicae]|jgi:DNA-binding MurR/RpiR family transcriptional regulator|uniref:MurR/RpiR family transcriptional regulator n=1 Tax=Patulibacter brassicae TaxID=1705717 RepID=A0ABU4VDX6_9ACTN|nr:MurR/RpiR family transcriptional regulator [Patulibacter brassicae]MDX8149997.1 MurR/RpiR family transcriptional regulator [Patulibacter brassicae]